jgi:branched-chain amino acid transport system substrate-binding protein
VAFNKAARAYSQERGSTAAGWGYELDENNQNVRADMYVMQWNSDKLETVWPPEAAVREPVILPPFGV